MINAKIDDLRFSFEESYSHFKLSENLEKIRRTNGPNSSSPPIYNKKRFLLPIAGTSLPRIIRGHTCGVTIVTRTTTPRLIAEQSPNLNSRKRLFFEVKSGNG
jgi:hypothetical protein